MAKDSHGTPSWHQEFGPTGQVDGFFERLDHHAIVHIGRPSTTLVVTFDNLANVADQSADRVPWGHKFLLDQGHAHLGIMAYRKDWFREPGLISALHRLRDGGIFSNFERVLFTGTSMGGFAALAFSSLAPGCDVLAFSPQSTLDTDLVPWETRFGMGKMRNWRLQHSDASFEIEHASRVCVISDPYFELDQRHVDRLATNNVTKLKAWYSGHFSPVFLRRAEILKPIMLLMLKQELTTDAFYRLYRARRNLPWYKRSLEEIALKRGRPDLANRVGPAFHRKKKPLENV